MFNVYSIAYGNVIMAVFLLFFPAPASLAGIPSIPRPASISPPASISSHPESFSTCINGPARTLSVSASGTGTLGYQWDSKSGTDPWVNIEGATGNSYTPPTNQEGTMFYRVRVTSGDGSVVFSNVATVTIYRAPAFGISVPAEAVCLNSALTVNSNIDVSVWDIEWERSSDSVSWQSTGVNTPGIEHPTSAPGKTWYRLKARPKGVPNPICSPVSGAASVEVSDCMSLAVTKTASPAEILAGDIMTYTINVTNRGPSALRPDQTITIKDPLPEGFNLQSIDANGNLNLPGQTWTGIELQPGESETITINGRVSADYEGDPLLNEVTVVPPEEVRNISKADSIASVKTPVKRSANLEISKTASSAAVKAGQALNYTITITNNGPSRILTEDVFNLPDNLPDGYVVRNYVAEEGEFNYLTGDWTEVDFTVGKTITLTIYGSVSSTFTGNTISNTASVVPPPQVTDPVMPNVSSVSTAVSQEADLQVTKTGPGKMTQNEEIGYSVTVANNGPSYARNVSITDVVPPEIAVDSWQADPGPGARILSGESGTGNAVDVTANIPPGSEVVIRIRGTVSSTFTGRSSNTASAVLPAEIFDPTTPNEDTHSVVLTGLDDLLLRKRGPRRAPSGGRVTYTLQLINNSSSAITGIQFTDDITPANVLNGLTWNATPSDPGITVAPASGSSFPIEFQTGIPPGEKITIVVRGSTTAGFTGDIVNNASAVSGTITASGQATTTIYKPASIELVKSGPEQAEAGSEITYTITATNQGEGASGEITITDRLPLGSRFVGTNNGGLYNENYHIVTWPEIDSLVPGQTVEHSITLATPADGDSIINVATANSIRDRWVTELNPMADLEVSKEAPDSVYQEDEFTYIIRAVNNGPSTARNVTLTDEIPADLEIIDAGGGTRSGQEISWLIPSIPKNGVHIFQVQVRAPAKNANLTNTVAISSETPDPDAANNNFSAATVVLPSADLLVEKTGPAEAFAGEEIDYEFTVTNLGPSPSGSVEVSDRFPSGTEFISSDIAPVDTFAFPITWRIENLEVGESRTFGVRVKTPGRTGVIRNIGEVKSGINDKDLTNNRSVFATTLTPAADVEVIKGGTAAIDSAGVIIYEILVRNNGPSSARNISIRDELPGSLGEPRSISNGGTYDAASHSVSWPVLPAMAAGTERLFTVTMGVTSEENVFTASNTALVTSDVFDPDTGNNRSVFETGVYPPADVFFELSPARICKGSPAVTLSGGGVRNDIPGEAVYSGPGVNEGIFDPGALEAGDYEILYTFTSPGGTKIVLRDTLHLLPAAFADAGPDLEILAGDSIALQGKATGEIIGWTPAGSLNDPAAVRPVAAPTETTTYILTSDNPGVCSDSDEVTVFVYPRLEVPNAITPNNDAVNDTWRIVNIEEYPNAVVQVFSRHGDLLFTSRGYAEEWEGEYNNEPLPPGTYYYVIRPNGGILKPFSGSITIIR